MSNKFNRISDVVLEPEIFRFSTKVDGLDACLSESESSAQGLPYGTSILLSGMPGGGKSTISTYMAAAQHGKESIIFHGEERATRVKERWQRLGLSGADPFVIELKHAEAALDAIRKINALPHSAGVGMVIVDSVQTITYHGKRKYDAQLEACEAIVGQVGSFNGCTVFVCHVDKAGKNSLGAAGLPHLVDIHLHLTSNAKKGERMLEVRKNRCGRAGFSVPVNIHQNGISVGVPEPMGLSASAPLPPPASSLPERGRDIAVKLLLEGEHVNSYTILGMTDVKMSIPTWNTGLEMAVQFLIANDHNIIKEYSNGKKGYRIEKNKEQPKKEIENKKFSDKIIDGVLPIEID